MIAGTDAGDGRAGPLGPDGTGEDGTGEDGTGAPDDVIALSLRLPASPARVFTALTDPDWLARWLAPVAGVEPHVGGGAEFLFVNRNGTFSLFQGQVTAYDRPHRLAFTWHHEGWQLSPLHVQFTLTADGQGTDLRLEQRGFAGQPVERDVYEVGWAHYLGRLAALFSG